MATAMGLVTLDLPAPAQLRGRWAAFAAICAARGWESTCHARDGVWHFDDSGGNWAQLHLLDGGRAVLIGHDHEYSDTYYGPAAEEFGEDETDLLADAPDWWRPVVRRTLDAKLLVGFVYGYDAAEGWRRAEYAVDDGFHSVGLPALTGLRTHETIVAYARHAPGTGGADAPREAVEALVAADGEVTAAQVRAVVAPGAGGGRPASGAGGSTAAGAWDAAAGVAAARAFLTG
ncbi:proteophosphoglycan 5 [Streptomyces sp. NPDC017941]|uniref:proteophosphoglycan 5 n=1 Tax=Streptomyces sp. NPDC017941 TaxID=3365018 RepID=UPI00379B17E9